MHLKSLLKALTYRLMIVFMCGTLASVFVKFVYSADSVNNIECAFIAAEELNSVSRTDVVLKNPAQIVHFEPKQVELNVETDVPYPLRIKTVVHDTS